MTVAGRLLLLRLRASAVLWKATVTTNSGRALEQGQCRQKMATRSISPRRRIPPPQRQARKHGTSSRRRSLPRLLHAHILFKRIAHRRCACSEEEKGGARAIFS
jgi:hypothetical protein